MRPHCGGSLFGGGGALLRAALKSAAAISSEEAKCLNLLQRQMRALNFFQDVRFKVRSLPASPIQSPLPAQQQQQRHSYRHSPLVPLLASPLNSRRSTFRCTSSNWMHGITLTSQC